MRRNPGCELNSTPGRWQNLDAPRCSGQPAVPCTRHHGPVQDCDEGANPGGLLSPKYPAFVADSSNISFPTPSSKKTAWPAMTRDGRGYRNPVARSRKKCGWDQVDPQKAGLTLALGDDLKTRDAGNGGVTSAGSSEEGEPSSKMATDLLGSSENRPR